VKLAAALVANDSEAAEYQARKLVEARHMLAVLRGFAPAAEQPMAELNGWIEEVHAEKAMTPAA
jgi:hypothetical protein